MLKYNIQFFGGRGASSGSGGPSLSSGSGRSTDIQDTLIIEEYGGIAPNNREFANEIEEGVDIIMKDFPGVHNESIREVSAVVFGGRDSTRTLGVYTGDGMVGLNTNFTDASKMNNVYDSAVKSGFHPARGNKSGAQAVTFHEMGHALTDYAGKKMGGRNIDQAAKIVVDNAYKANRGKGGTKAWAKKISGYATENYAECIAEAVADFYCNGRKANSASKAIVAELKKYS